MSKEKEETGISILTGAGTENLKVSKDDVVAIFVSDYEDDLDRELLEKNDEVKKLDKEMQLKSKEVQLALKKEFDAVTDDFKKKVSSSLELCGLNVSKFTASYSVADNSAVVQITSQNYSGEHETVGITKAFKSQSADVKKLQKELSTLRDSRSDAGDRIRTIKQDLNNVSRQERKVRAAIAKSSLEKTEEGRKFIADVTKNKTKAKAITVKE
jgi:hypothetical protein